MKNVALILAAGKSTRCGFDKLVAQLGHQTVLERCLQTFEECDAIDDIWVVGSEVPPLGLRGGGGGDTKVKGSTPGGDSRFNSVRVGLEHCAKIYDTDVRIIVHNAANPWLRVDDLTAGLKEAETKLNLIFGFFSPNSIKQVQNEKVVNFLDRAEIFETQTPQISTLSTFVQALEAFKVRTQSSNTPAEFELEAREPPDEAELLTVIDQPIHVYECDPSNIKITYASDLVPPLACGHIALSQREKISIGLGEDSHRFADTFIPEKPFRLGGIDMSEGPLSSDGNSDGDVILHALCNALLSAFGDTTFDLIAAPICAAGDTNSTSYLKATLKHLEGKHNLCIPSSLRSAPLKPKGAKIQQVLISLEGAQPKIAPQHHAIQNNVAQLLGIKPSQVGLTYTTGEGLTDFGKGLGMRSYVLVTLKA